MTLRNRSAGSSADAKLQWAAVRNAIADGPYWIGPGGRRSRWRKLLLNRLVALFAKGIRLTLLYQRGRQNALNLGVFEFEVTLSGVAVQNSTAAASCMSATLISMFSPSSRMLHGNCSMAYKSMCSC